jgi:hypothetical protein
LSIDATRTAKLEDARLLPGVVVTRAVEITQSRRRRLTQFAVALATITPTHGGSRMALSEDSANVAARAKDAQTRAAAAADKARTDLEQEVSSARESAQAQAERLRDKAEAAEAKVASRQTDIQRSFNEHVARAREGIDTKRAERDVKQQLECVISTVTPAALERYRRSGGCSCSDGG